MFSLLTYITSGQSVKFFPPAESCLAQPHATIGRNSFSTLSPEHKFDSIVAIILYLAFRIVNESVQAFSSACIDSSS